MKDAVGKVKPRPCQDKVSGRKESTMGEPPLSGGWVGVTKVHRQTFSSAITKPDASQRWLAGEYNFCRSTKSYGPSLGGVPCGRWLVLSAALRSEFLRILQVF